MNPYKNSYLWEDEFMISLKKLGLVVGLALGSIALTWAAENFHGEVHPKDRKLIFVEGKSSLTEFMNAVKLSFKFTTEKDSFEEAAKTGENIVKKMQEVAGKIGQARVIYGWDLLKQSRISWGEKGRKITQTVQVEVENIPQGKLFTVLPHLIDTILPISSSLELESITTYITAALEQDIRTRLYSQAVALAQKQAKTIADSSDGKLVGPYRIFANNNLSHATRDVYASQDFFDGNVEGIRTAAIQLHRSFKLETEIQDSAEYSTTILGAFEIK